MQYEIKRAGTTIATVTPTGKQSKKIMDINIVDMAFSLAAEIDLTVGDYVDVYGERYTLEDLADVKKVSRVNFEYTLQFRGKGYELIDRSFLNLDSNNDLSVAIFSITGTASDILDLLILNANKFGDTWVKGVIDDTDADTFDITEDDNCLSVLSTLAERFKTEWWIENQTIHLTKKGTVQNISLRYGINNGLYNITRTTDREKKLITRLYAYGSTDNLPGNYRGSSKYLKLPGVNYIERNVNKYGGIPIEGNHVFTEIKPEFKGTVGTVVDNFSFICPEIDFNINDQQLPDVKPNINFLSGQLSGKSFEIGGYDPVTHKVTILANDDEPSLILPSDLFHPEVGDKFNFTEIIMPQSYIDNAEARLMVAANALLVERSDSNVTYSVECDPLNFKTRGIVLSLGDYVQMSDTDLSLNGNIRLAAFDRDLQEPFKYPNVDFNEVISISKAVSKALEYRALKAAVRINNLTNALEARRNAKNLVALKDLVLDPDGNYFTDKIKPRSIETLYLSVGAVATNFDLKGISFEANYGGDANSFGATAGQLVHYDLQIPGSGFVWEMAQFMQTGLTPATTYYLYAKISKTSLTGVWELSPDVKTVESLAGYYILQAGVLFPVKDGRRDNQITKGMVFIVGDQITAGRIKSLDENMFMDLTTGQFNLGDETGGIDWNVSRANALTIRGSVFQSATGVIAPVPLNRGVYNPVITYGAGDIVSYGGGSWIYINDIPDDGHTPADDTYWDVFSAKGDAGTGTPGADGTTTYTWVKYADTPTTGITDNPAGKSYIGLAFNKTTSTPSTSYSDYNWSLVKGADGTSVKILGTVATVGDLPSTGNILGDGYIVGVNLYVWSGSSWTNVGQIKGGNGSNGQTTYVHIKYSDDAGATFTASSGEFPGAYMGIYSDFNSADSNVVGAYTWAQIKGATGNNGQNGNYTELRFQKNGSTSSAPTLTVTDLNPSGWTLAQPTLGTGEYLWMVSALRSGVDNSLLTNWSAAVRTSGADGSPGVPGDPGAPGSTGPLGPFLSYTGSYDSGRTYVGSTTRIEAVKYLGNYYFSRTDSGSFSGQIPTNTAYWNAAGATFDSVATGLLLASAATIDNLTVRNVKTADSGKRVVISGDDNNIRLINSAGQDLLLIDDDAAITGYNASLHPIYGPGIMIGDPASNYLSLASNGLKTSGDIEARSATFDNEVKANHSEISIFSGSGNLPADGLILATGNCNLYTNPKNGHIQRVKNITGGTINVNAAQTTGSRFLLLNNGVFYDAYVMPAYGFVTYIYYQPGNYWVQMY